MRTVELTEQQRAFVAHFTSTPGAIGNAAAAARMAGYSERCAREIGRQLLDKPHVRKAIDEANRQSISGTLATKAVGLLERVIDDEDAPLKVRVEAAKTILDRAGIVQPSVSERVAAGDGKLLSEMSVNELEAFIRAGQAIAAQQRSEHVPLPAAGKESMH